MVDEDKVVTSWRSSSPDLLELDTIKRDEKELIALYYV